ncbi:MAG: hypothetical protein ACLU4J_08515 [Butyricimonas paravirosa]
MEWLQSLLDSSTTPALTAFAGLLTAISLSFGDHYCAIGFIGKTSRTATRYFETACSTRWDVSWLHAPRHYPHLNFGRRFKPVWYPKFIGKYGEMPRTRTIIHRLSCCSVTNSTVIRFKCGEGLARRGGWGALLLGYYSPWRSAPTSGVFISAC